jgi:hypothetical protein
LRSLNYTLHKLDYFLINIHAPTNNSVDEAKDSRKRREDCVGGRKYSLHETTSENGIQLIEFAARRQMATRSTYFMHKKIHQQAWNFPDGPTFNQIDHCMIEGRYFSDVNNVRAQRVANIDMQSIHDITKSTTETFCSQKTEVRSNKLMSGFQCAHDDQARSLNELWYETEKNIKKIAATTVSYAQSYKNSCARGDPKSKHKQS